MERILEQLRANEGAADDDTLLRETIAVLVDIQRHPDGPHPTSWAKLRNNFQLLRDRGLWEHSAENDELLDALHVLFTSPSKKSVEPLGEKISIIVPPAQNISSQLVSPQDHLVLPTELIDILNKAYFLHILATEPAQVLPPGKSLLSVMSRTHTAADEIKPTLHSKVEDLVYKAFWDEALDTLSNPQPSVQLPRIKLLYKDLHVALSPVLPPNHPVLVTLSNPLSPTSSPLDSALVHLREILASLRERCAPVRDPVIEAFQRPLDDLQLRSPRLVTLAKLVAETIRNILRLSEIMKDDLSQFVLGNMTEQQLQSLVSKQARETERTIVIDIWHRSRITQGWVSWLNQLEAPAHLSSVSAPQNFLWITRIIQALGLPFPVSCFIPLKTVQIHPTASSSHDNQTTELPIPNVNTLPPIFFFSGPTLLKIQNYLQALVITASLRILARIPAHTKSSHINSNATDTNSFTSRIWTLLRAEIVGEPDASDTKIINLADEVVQARIQSTPMPSASGALSEEDETALRTAIDRTLRVEDPVYKLLLRRLLTELSDVLIKHRMQGASQNSGRAAVPTTLRTGREGGRMGKRPRLMLDPEDIDGSHTTRRGSLWKAIDVKGFEDPVLRRAITEVFEQVDSCLGWVESVWSDVIETGNVKDDVSDGVGSSPRRDDVQNKYIHS